MDRTNFKHFAKIYLPVVLLLGLVSATVFVEWIFLADFSEEAFKGGLNGFFLARVFQMGCFAVVIVGQAFVGHHHGAGRLHQIGPCVWQLIWFSLLSMLIVVPLGLSAERWMFDETPLASAASSYFSIICNFNFLFPLGSALSAFYIGRGFARPIVLLTILTCLLNVALDYLLIFGWGTLPSMGAAGAAMGRVVAQAVFCGVLFFLFLNRANREMYATHLWRFSKKLFWHYVRPGTFRALGTFFALADWALISRFMTLKGEAHALVFGVGSTIFFFMACFGDGIYQTMITMTSNRMGKNEFSQVWASFRSGVMMVIFYGLFLALPFFYFLSVFEIGFSNASFYPQITEIFQQMNAWLWLAILAYGFNSAAVGVVVAARDTKFISCLFGFLWVISFLPVFIAMQWFDCPPRFFWLIYVGTNLISCSAFLWRASKEKWKQDEPSKLPISDIEIPLN